MPRQFLPSARAGHRPAAGVPQLQVRMLSARGSDDRSACGHAHHASMGHWQIRSNPPNTLRGSFAAPAVRRRCASTHVRRARPLGGCRGRSRRAPTPPTTPAACSPSRCAPHQGIPISTDISISWPHSHACRTANSSSGLCKQIAGRWHTCSDHDAIVVPEFLK